MTSLDTLGRPRCSLKPSKGAAQGAEAAEKADAGTRAAAVASGGRVLQVGGVLLGCIAISQLHVCLPGNYPGKCPAFITAQELKSEGGSPLGKTNLDCVHHTSWPHLVA